MKRWLWVVALLLPVASFAQNKKLQGYIMNAGAFGKIHTYCVDTHNLPPEEVRVVDHFVSEESKAKGLLTRLPWRRYETCQDADVDALVRLEFPHDSPLAPNPRNEVKGVLLVFRPGSPSPIYETPAVTISGNPRRNEDDPFDVKLVAGLLEYSAAGSVVRMLIHDWQRQ
jgi:hypothetical protein